MCKEIKKIKKIESKKDIPTNVQSIILKCVKKARNKEEKRQKLKDRSYEK